MRHPEWFNEKKHTVPVGIDSGNLISQKTIYEDGKTNTTIYEYDTMGNKISEKDGLFDTSSDEK